MSKIQKAKKRGTNKLIPIMRSACLVRLKEVKMNSAQTDQIGTQDQLKQIKYRMTKKRNIYY